MSIPAALSFDFRYALEGIPAILSGLIVTVLLAAVVMAVCLPFGIMLAVVRLSRLGPIVAVAYTYTELFRTTPVLVWVFLLFFALPVQFRLGIDPFWVAVLALSLNVSAFLGEIIRGAILSIDPGQRDAAIATGMTERQALRRIVLPQAFLRSIPLIAAIWISLFKDVSLAAIINVHEMVYHARLIAANTFRSIEVFTVVALIYIAVTYPQAVIVNKLFDKFRVQE